MEFIDGGDLSNLLKIKKLQSEPIPEDHLWDIALQITTGLHNLHSRGILHRDIKLSNILTTKLKTIKICDMGVSQMLNTIKSNHKRVGTPLFISPEIVKN